MKVLVGAILKNSLFDNGFSKDTFIDHAVNELDLLSHQHIGHIETRPGPEVIKLFSCSTQLNMKF